MVCRPNLDAVRDAFVNEVDFAQLIKHYAHPGPHPEASRRYSPSECIGTEKRPILGEPDEKHISTSHVERQNLTMRMNMRRFTRLTNAFSKKAENHIHAISLHFMYYNFCRIHATLRMSPAMRAGVSDTLWDVADLVRMVEKWEAHQASGRYEVAFLARKSETIAVAISVSPLIAISIVDSVFLNSSAT